MESLKKYVLFIVQVILISGLPSSIKAQTMSVEERQVSAFHTLNVSGLATVYLSQGDSQRIKLVVSGMPIEDVIVNEVAGVLTITTKGTHSGESAKIYVSSSTVKTITVSKAAELIGLSTIQSDQLGISLLDAASAKLDVNVGTLKTTLNGGDLEISGKANYHEMHQLEFSSRGQLDKSALSIKN